MTSIAWYVLYKEKWCCKNTEGFRRSKENMAIRRDAHGKYWIFFKSACFKIEIRRNILFISWQLLILLLWKPTEYLHIDYFFGKTYYKLHLIFNGLQCWRWSKSFLIMSKSNPLWCKDSTLAHWGTLDLIVGRIFSVFDMVIGKIFFVSCR